MKKALPILFIFSAFLVQAQYSTPGTGVKWDLQTLAENSEGVITQVGDHFELEGHVIISENDTLEILTNETLLLHSLSYMETYGGFIIDAPEQMIFSAVDPETTETKWRGIRFREGHYTYLRNVIFEYGGGLKVYDGGVFYMDGCTLRYNFYKSGSSAGSFSSGGVLDITGPATIVNCEIYENQRGAIATPSNVGSPVIFRNNYLFGNTTENSNRPQVNLGPSGSGNTSYVVGNTIIGNGHERSGGIAYSALLGGLGDVVIDSNYVEANRYGITITGSGMNGWIRYNTLIDNNIENNPALGGSGINLTASSASAYQHVTVTGNVITGHLWGITIIGYPEVNMGNNDPENYNPGLNVFSDNGNEGLLYDLYNNGPLPQFAMGNLWNVELQDAESIETVITHQVDDEELGLVTFMPAAQKLTFLATDAEENLLEGVTIEIEGLETELSTNDEGIASIITMQGAYSFVASLEGFEDFSGDFTLGAEALQIPIIMSEITYTLTFEVNDGTDPIEGALINIDEEELTTDADGKASIQLINGTYPYEVTAEGYIPQTGEAVIDGENLGITITLTEITFTATFEVNDGTDPVEDALISIDGQELITDADGIATIELVPGEYDFGISIDGYEDYYGTITVVDQDITVVVSIVEVQYILTFIVTSDDAPLEGANIDIAGETLTTDAGGKASIHLINGTYPYEVTADEHTSASGEAVIDGENLEIAITLSSTVGITELPAFNIYPNPASSYVRIEGLTILKAELWQVQGVIVRTFQNPSASLNIEGIPSGYYFLRLQTPDQVIVHRLIIR